MINKIDWIDCRVQSVVTLHLYKGGVLDVLQAGPQVNSAVFYSQILQETRSRYADRPHHHRQPQPKVVLNNCVAYMFRYVCDPLSKQLSPFLQQADPSW
jgi:hypothetical protein